MKSISSIHTAYNTIISFVGLLVFSLLMNRISVYIGCAIILLVVAAFDLRKLIFKSNQIEILYSITGRRKIIKKEDLYKIEINSNDGRKSPPVLVVIPKKYSNYRFLKKIFALRVFTVYLNSSFSIGKYYFYIKNYTNYFDKVEMLNFSRKEMTSVNKEEKNIDNYLNLLNQ